jgi:hypothetical protein
MEWLTRQLILPHPRYKDFKLISGLTSCLPMNLSNRGDLMGTPIKVSPIVYVRSGCRLFKASLYFYKYDL